MTFTESRPPRMARRPDVLTAILQFAASSHTRAVLLLLAASLLAFVPGVFQLPAIDREEARAVQATRQMLESGDYFTIRFQNDLQQGKPVGVHWAQAATVRLGRAVGIRDAESRIWLYRLPSLLGAIVAVLLTYWAALPFVSRRAALLAALLLAASVLLGIQARLAKADALLLASAVLVMGALGRIYIGAHRADPPDRVLAAVFWAALAAGTLLSGLTIILLTVLCLVTLVLADRSSGWLTRLYPVSGAAFFVALLLPWALYIALRRQESLMFSLLTDLFNMAVGESGHRALTGTHALLFWVTFWPGAALVALAGVAAWSARQEPAARFLLAWLLPAWITFELMLTKLPHFVLPLYPAVAVLIAGVVHPPLAARPPWLVRGTMWWFVFATLAGLAGLVVMMVVGRQLGLLAWPFVAGAMIFALLAWRLYEVDGAERSVLRAVIAALLLGIGVYGVMLPNLGVLFPALALKQTIVTRECPHPAVAAAGFHEPSLVFELGTDTRLTDGAGAAEFLRGGPCRAAVVEARQERAFVARAEYTGLRYAARPRIETYNFNAGRWMLLAVYVSDNQP